MSAALRAANAVGGFGRGRRANTVDIVGCSFFEQPKPKVSCYVSQIACIDRCDIFNSTFSNVALPPSQVTRIDFFRPAPDAAGAGVGIGLRAVKAVVLRRGGCVWVRVRGGARGNVQHPSTAEENGQGR